MIIREYKEYKRVQPEEINPADYDCAEIVAARRNLSAHRAELADLQQLVKLKKAEIDIAETALELAMTPLSLRQPLLVFADSNAARETSPETSPETEFEVAGEIRATNKISKDKLAATLDRMDRVDGIANAISDEITGRVEAGEPFLQVLSESIADGLKLAIIPRDFDKDVDDGAFLVGFGKGIAEAIADCDEISSRKIAEAIIGDMEAGTDARQEKLDFFDAIFDAIEDSDFESLAALVSKIASQARANALSAPADPEPLDPEPKTIPIGKKPRKKKAADSSLKTGTAS